MIIINYYLTVIKHTHNFTQPFMVSGYVFQLARKQNCTLHGIHKQ